MCIRDSDKSASFQYTENGHPTGTLRFAIVGITLQLPVPQHIGIDVMGGIMVLFPHF